MIILGNLKKKYREALVYFVKSSFPHQMWRNLEIRVSFKKNLGRVHGLVYIEDYNYSNEPRSFVIEVNKSDPEEEIIKTLAHEVEHIRQYVYGELNEEMTFWKGRKVNPDKMNYYEQPWEKEANKIGDLMYSFYILTKDSYK